MESERPRKGKLLDPDEIVEGLDMGTRYTLVRWFWDWIEYYHAHGKRSLSLVLYIVFLHFVGITYSLGGFLGAIFIDMDFKKRTAAIMNPICGCQTVFKCASFSFATGEYVKMLVFLRRDFMTCIPKEQEERAKLVMKENVKETNQFMKYAMTWNMVTLVMISGMPHLKSQAFREFFHIGEGPIVPNKMFENEYPFDWNRTAALYYMTCVYEQIAGLLAIFTSSAYQAVLILLVMAVTSHLKVLGFAMENLRASDFAPGQYLSLTPEQKEKAYERLIRCVKDHQKIIEAGEALADRYNSFLTFHLGTAILVGIIAIFNCTAAEEVPAKVNFFVMCVYGLLEVAIYCIAGQMLENASEDVLRQVYQCDWHEMSPKFRKAAQLMMVRANNPLTLRAGRLYQVNFETLAAILQLVYSSLTVLSTTV